MSEIECKVVSTPEYDNSECTFLVMMNDEVYKVVSCGYQAIKDHIFVDKEQILSIEGRIIEDTIITERSKIRFMNKQMD